MDITVDRRPNVHVVIFTGRLDTLAAGDLQQSLEGELDGGAKNLLLDFSEVIYLSSAALAVLLLVWNRLRETNGIVAICNPAPNIRNTLEITGFAKRIELFDNRAEALRRFPA